MRLKRCKLCGCLIYDEFNESGICDVCEDELAENKDSEEDSEDGKRENI